MSRAKIVKGQEGDRSDLYLAYSCPGCDDSHVVPVTGPRAWGWNQSLERPSLQPSVLVNVGGTNPAAPVCHSFVTDGEIRYLPDSTHALAGRTVPIPECDP